MGGRSSKTQDAVEMPPNEPATVGRAAIRHRYASWFEVGAETSEFTLTSVDIDGMDGLAYDRGTWTWTGIPPGMTELITDTGKYLGIARRQEDGTWLWTAVIWNSDLPLPQPE
jgi:ketosteroid isomerase-like protein